MSESRYTGFTLAELLIALAILGVIATFTIPKILAAQQDSNYNARAKETASMVSAAYQQYTLQNGASTSIGIANITQYMNYVRADNSATIDSFYNDSSASRSCGISSGMCLKLHNGAYLQYWPADQFGGTATTNGVPFLIDPDGANTASTTNGPGKSLYFVLYYNGKILDQGNFISNTGWNNNTGWTRNVSKVPPWFSW